MPHEGGDKGAQYSRDKPLCCSSYALDDVTLALGRHQVVLRLGAHAVRNAKHDGKGDRDANDAELPDGITAKVLSLGATKGKFGQLRSRETEPNPRMRLLIPFQPHCFEGLAGGRNGHAHHEHGSENPVGGGVVEGVEDAANERARKPPDLLPAPPRG